MGSNSKKSKGEYEFKKLKELNLKYANDPEFRETVRNQNRERYQKDPSYRKKTLERSKNRYHNDPVYRKATIERAKERYRKNKLNKESE